MDLSWCIICENHIDDNMIESSLYCSESCRNKDQTNHMMMPTSSEQQQPLLPSNLLFSTIKSSSSSSPFLINNNSKTNMKPSTSTSLLRNKRSNITTSYPWEFFYNRPRNKRHVLVKRCQPLVSSSLTTATAFFTPKSSMA
ncbi:unnamed protein product [Cunninghamella blakesleeana]